jgi:hypothetical protein
MCDQQSYNRLIQQNKESVDNSSENENDRINALSILNIKKGMASISVPGWLFSFETELIEVV